MACFGGFGPENAISAPFSGHFWHPRRLCSPIRGFRRMVLPSNLSGGFAHAPTRPSCTRTPDTRPPSSPPGSAELPDPPPHLSEAMQIWWRQVNADYALDPHHLHLLECAADAWDRMVQAREVLRTEGLSVPTKDGGKKKHPASDVERDSR